ncbi:MAG: penicillin-binding transpeptidase domain-containing protein [Chloroflexota bacterium]|nr:penicillin-binding transpeptidase domain-containing protein [Chloroflexota bacterium]
MKTRRPLPLALLSLLLAACSNQPSPTPYPTQAPIAPPEAARAVAEAYLQAWAHGDHAAMYKLVAPADQQRYPEQHFDDLHATFGGLARVTVLYASAGDARPSSVAAEPRPPDLPAPTPTPSATVDPSASAPATPTAEPTPAAAFDPGAPLPGPVPAMAVPLQLAFKTDLFGEVDLEREVKLTQGASGWQVRWTPALLFPELGTNGELRLTRTTSPRGRIKALDGTVYAETRADGKRVYPHDWLAGQTIGYVSEVTAEELPDLLAKGYESGDMVGRSGLEFGAEELLRGTPGFELQAVSADGPSKAVLHRDLIPGANLTITLRAGLQATAEAAIGSYAEAATVALDPRSGDLWALASAPLFNPNGMTLGTTFGGQPLAAQGSGQILNRAVQAAYPAGSSFKPFTLSAALKSGVAAPSTLVTCPPSWTYSQDFTAVNYQRHSLPGLVSLAQAMAFSCNTTYMPLGLSVYQADPDLFPALLHDFGFGRATGVQHLIEETGVLPDAAWLARERSAAYGPFDQIQMSIGQGFFLGTPLQLTNAYAAIGNGGTLWVPRLVTAATLPDGRVVETTKPTVKGKIPMTPEQLDYVVETLKAVVNLPYGTGYIAFAGFGLQVAGKSGTAETGGPDPDAWFPAFAPSDDPLVAAATLLGRVHLATGGADAAPLVRRVFAAFFAAPS